MAGHFNLTVNQTTGVTPKVILSEPPVGTTRMTHSISIYNRDTATRIFLVQIREISTSNVYFLWRLSRTTTVPNSFLSYVILLKNDYQLEVVMDAGAATTESDVCVFYIDEVSEGEYAD